MKGLVAGHMGWAQRISTNGYVWRALESPFSGTARPPKMVRTPGKNSGVVTVDIGKLKCIVSRDDGAGDVTKITVSFSHGPFAAPSARTARFIFACRGTKRGTKSSMIVANLLRRGYEMGTAEVISNGIAVSACDAFAGPL